MVREYELMYIVRPDLEDDQIQRTVESVQAIIEAQGGEVRRTTPWGRRRLAYPIQKLRDGHYYLVEMRLDADKVREVDRALRIHDHVIRHLITIFVPGKADADGRRAASPATTAAGPGTTPVAGEHGESLDDGEVIEEVAAAAEVLAEDVDNPDLAAEVAAAEES